MAQMMYSVYLWSRTDACTDVLDKYNQGIEALNARLEGEDDDGGETRAFYTRKIYCETFEVAVSSGAQVELSAPAKQLSTSIFHSVQSLTASMNLYGSLLPVVQGTINAYDSATRVESGADVASVGPLIGLLRAHERDIVNAIATVLCTRSVRRSTLRTA